MADLISVPPIGPAAVGPSMANAGCEKRAQDIPNRMRRKRCMPAAPTTVGERLVSLEIRRRRPNASACGKITKKQYRCAIFDGGEVPAMSAFRCLATSLHRDAYPHTYFSLQTCLQLRLTARGELGVHSRRQLYFINWQLPFPLPLEQTSFHFHLGRRPPRHVAAKYAALRSLANSRRLS